jgi:alanyl-tRNA synthetase
MSKRLYFESDSLVGIACVSTCALVDGKFEVILDETLFHPQGGGQASDIGTIGEIEVTHVAIRGGQLIHFTVNEVSVGPMKMIIDEPTRKLNSRLHSAGHLIGFVGERYGWHPTKAHHWPNEAKVVFKKSTETKVPSEIDFCSEVNKLIASNLDRKITNEAGVRRVSWGELPSYPCGGTHVASLSVIESVEGLAIKIKKDEISVHYSIA